MKENADLKIEKYIKILLRENQNQNLISRRINKESLLKLINESVLLSEHIKGKLVVDAGSGNGLIGVIIAIIHEDKKVIMVEKRKKRVGFLNMVILELNLKNAQVFDDDIKNFPFGKYTDINIVSRGFSNNQVLVDFLKNKEITGVLILTSENKINKINIPVENIKKNIYNIEFRDNLKILKMEKVSRET